MDIVKAIADLDEYPELHEARILLLLSAFDAAGQGAVEGLTKLAKLDFLLRYPVMLDRALAARGKGTRELRLEDHERQSVESEMVRYRFGPWDHRYREVLNVLVAKELAKVSIEGRKVVIFLTPRGREVAGLLASDPEFEQYSRRAGILKRNFDLSGTNLMKFIYQTFPEIISLRTNEAIPT